MLGDCLIAEPGALIGFAGPRTIAETIKVEMITLHVIMTVRLHQRVSRTLNRAGYTQTMYEPTRQGGLASTVWPHDSDKSTLFYL